MIALLAATDPLREARDGPAAIFGGRAGEILASIGLTKHTLSLVVAGLLVCAIFLWRARSVRSGEGVPRGFGGMVEAIMLFLREEVVRPIVGSQGDRYLPFIWTLFFLILTSNLLGLLPGMTAATGNIGINAGLAAVAFLSWHAMGIRELGLVGYLRNLVPPVPGFLWPFMLVIELAGHLVRPCTLAVRLFANMLAGHVTVATVLGFTKAFTGQAAVLGAAVSVGSVLAAVCLTFLELLTAFLQAFIFTLLTTVFIGLAVRPGH